MVKNLFGDLEGVDVLDKYDRHNAFMEKVEKINRLNERILSLSKETKNLEWAKRVVSFYENDIIDNEDILSEVKYFDKLDALVVEAEKYLKQEWEILEKENQLKKEKEALERKQRVKELDKKRAERKEVFVRAHEIDDEIQLLDYSNRTKKWCDEVYEYYTYMDTIDIEVKKHCQNLRTLDELRVETTIVSKLLQAEEKVGHINSSLANEEDYDWCKSILEFINKIDKSSNIYNKNKGWFNIVYGKIEKVKNQMAIVVEDRKIARLIQNYRDKEQAEKKRLQETLENDKRIEQERKLEQERKKEEERKKQEELKLQEEERQRQLKLEEEKKAKLEAEREARKEIVESIIKDAKALKLKCVEKDSKITIEGFDKGVGSVIKIPDGVEVIGAFAFYSCKKLVEIHIPNSVNHIEEYAFSKCKRLRKVFIYSDDVNIIEKFTFQDCKKLKTIVANGVDHIQESAFEDCSSLVSVEMKKLSYVYIHAFRRCKKLKSIKSDKIIQNEKMAFHLCNRLDKKTRGILATLR